MIKCPICRLDFNDKDLVVIDFIFTIYHYTCSNTQFIQEFEIGPFYKYKKFFQIENNNFN
jgi:hypothetical protein